MKRILILGGAGFIGSNLAKLLQDTGYPVTIVDGLLEDTGGSEENVPAGIESHFLRIEDVPSLPSFLSGYDFIIDGMGWTSHVSSFENPLYDMSLNLGSHITFLNAIEDTPNYKVIYLGSRSQLGKVGEGIGVPETPSLPVDIQGVHKAAAENLFRIYSKKKKFSVISLRVPNCFGENQKINGKDIGLVGSFCRTALSGGEIQVFGENRTRNLIYVKDLVKIIHSLLEVDHYSFQAFDLAGQKISILQLANKITEIAGFGRVVLKEMPSLIKEIDPGELIIDQNALEQCIGIIPETKLEISLKHTIENIKKRISYDMEM